MCKVRHLGTWSATWLRLVSITKVRERIRRWYLRQSWVLKEQVPLLCWCGNWLFSCLQLTQSRGRALMAMRPKVTLDAWVIVVAAACPEILRFHCRWLGDIPFIGIVSCELLTTVFSCKALQDFVATRFNALIWEPLTADLF